MRLEFFKNANFELVTPPPVIIFTPGTQGFGVGVCYDQNALARLNLQPMEGCEDPASDNYGNYIHTPNAKRNGVYSSFQISDW